MIRCSSLSVNLTCWYKVIHNNDTWRMSKPCRLLTDAYNVMELYVWWKSFNAMSGWWLSRVKSTEPLSEAVPFRMIIGTVGSVFINVVLSRDAAVQPTDSRVFWVKGIQGKTLNSAWWESPCPVTTWIRIRYSTTAWQHDTHIVIVKAYIFFIH